MTGMHVLSTFFVQTVLRVKTVEMFKTFMTFKSLRYSSCFQHKTNLCENFANLLFAMENGQLS